MRPALVLVAVSVLASFGLGAQAPASRPVPAVPAEIEQWMRAAWGADPRSLGYTEGHFLASLTEGEREGARLIKQRCNLCHYSHRLMIPTLAPVLTSKHVEGRDEIVRRKILEGSANMPAFKDDLTSTQIDQMISYLKKADADLVTSFFKPPARGGVPAAAVDPPRPVLSARGELSLHGTVTSTAGAKMPGVTVSARAAGRNVTLSVFTDEQGEYYFPLMERGRYKIWAQDQAFEAGRAEVTFNDNAVRQNFTLKPLDDFAIQASGDVWFAALPETTREDKRMKEVFRLTCMGCHGISYTFLTKFDEKNWRTIIDVMSRAGGQGYGNPAVAAKRAPHPIMVRFRDNLAAYLAKVRGPGPSAAKLTPRRATGDSARAVIREYDVPEPGFGLPLYNDGSDWSKGAPDIMDEAHRHTMNATVDHDGNLWASDYYNVTSTVAKIDWKTGQSTRFSVVGKPLGAGWAAEGAAEGGKDDPSKDDPTKTAVSGAHDIFTDEQGIVWFDLYSIGALGRVDPRVGKVDVIQPPAGDSVGAFAHKDGLGGIWVSAEYGGVRSPGDVRAIRYDPKTNTWTTRAINPLPNMQTYGMGAARDGSGWYSVQHPVDAIVRADYKTGKTTIIRLPAPTNDRSELFTREELQLFEPVRIGFYGTGKPGVQAIRKPHGDPTRDAVWGPGWYGDLMKIDTRTNTITSYPYPQGASTVNGYEASIDGEGNVWVVFTLADSIGKFDPKTETWTTYYLPSLGIRSHGIQAVTHNGRTEVSLGYQGLGKAAKLEFRTKEELQALGARARAAR